MSYFSQLNFDNLLHHVSINKRKLVICGLSNETKNLINRIKIDYILDNNAELQEQCYNDIPIISYDWIVTNLFEENCTIVIWGNHVEAFLEQVKPLSHFNIIVCTNKTHSLFKVTPLHFVHNTNSTEQKNLFKDSIVNMDIELSSYCNRVCWFCPNSYIDRKSNPFYLDFEIFKSIINDLSTISYDNYISFNGYSEPTANPLLGKYLKFAKEKLPHAILHINTNGDYISQSLLENLNDNGLDSLNIQLYLTKDELFNYDNVSKHLKHIVKKIPFLDIKPLRASHNHIEFSSSYKNINIRLYSKDFSTKGVDRGNIDVTTNKNERIYPCTAVFNQFIINYLGEVLPCCNIRTDIVEQNNMLYGKVTPDTSIFKIYSNAVATKWRKSLIRFDTKFPIPCTSCQFVLPSKSLLLKEYIQTL